MTEIVPTNGRIVWYTPYSNEMQGNYGMVTQRDKDGNVVPLMAQVCAVHGSRCVNLLVTDANGKTFPVTSRTLIQDGDERNRSGGYAEWMPYQKKVASGEIAPTLHAEPKA